MSIFAAITVVVVIENVMNLQGIELQPLTGLSSLKTLPDFTQFQVTRLQTYAFF
jgi:hypothetical protein